jgi:hypothetical protein
VVIRWPREMKTPEQLRALILHYGDKKTAAKRLGISERSLSIAATSDLKGRVKQMSPENQNKVEKAYNRLRPPTKKKITERAKIFKGLKEHPNVARALLNAKPDKREKFFKNYKKYRPVADSEKQLYQWLMTSLYHQHPKWRMGQFQT